MDPFVFFSIALMIVGFLTLIYLLFSSLFKISRQLEEIKEEVEAWSVSEDAD